MKYRLVYLLVLLIGMSWLPPVQAVVIEELYTIELPVADQTTSLRLEAFAEAFKLVVIKVSGSDDALRSPAFKRPMQRSARYVKQFRYISRKDTDAEGFDAGQLFLKIDFNQQLVEGLLRENDGPRRSRRCSRPAWLRSHWSSQPPSPHWSLPWPLRWRSWQSP